MGRNIAISGRMCSGKTTLANYLCDKYGYERVSFASPLKELEAIHSSFSEYQWSDLLDPIIDKIYSCQYSCSRDYIRSLLINIFSKVPRQEGKNRELLQNLGNSLRNQVDKDIWVSLFDKSVRNEKNDLVVDDLRYLNELTYLKSRDYTVIRLEIDTLTQTNRIIELYGALDHSALSHSSETNLDTEECMFDYIINSAWNIDTVRYIVDNEIMANI